MSNTNNKIIRLYCPICGNDQFISLDDAEFIDSTDSTRFKCSDCKNTFTKEEIIESNEDIINANIEEFEEDVLRDIEKELKKIFK